MAKLVSTTYGEALFELAQEAGMADSMLEEVCLLRNVLKANPQFHSLMKHPKISKEESLHILDEVLTGRVSQELTNFIKLLLEKDRYADLDEIFDYFELRVKEAEGIGVVFVRTAVELRHEQKAAIEQKLLATTGYRRMEMNYEVDASLIGGMQIRIKDRVVDSSIKSKLEGMERELRKIQLG